MGRQIPLSFPVNESYEAHDFMPLPCNDGALKWINRYPDWSAPMLIIYGEKGCGKTHLLSYSRMIFHDGVQYIDNADGIFGDLQAEEKLFHDYNLAKENGTHLILTMEKPIAQYDAIQLPDLASRLRAAPSVEITPPDEVDLQAVLIKLFHDRQLQIEPDVIAYILPRIERSFAAVHALVQKIDENSLSEKRSVTIPLVRALLVEPALFVDGI